MTAPVIQFKRGALVNLPGLQAGEPGFTTDSYDFYIGLTSETSTNKFFGSNRYWSKETSSSGSGLNLVEGTSNGSGYITLKSPDSLSGVGTYTLPDTSTITDGYFLKVNSSGTLSWDTVGGTNGNFTSPTLSGLTTINDNFDVNASSDFSGITTFSNSTNNTLGDENTGAIQIDGGVGIAKNLTVKENLYVGGHSEFVGVATFKGGTINLGDGTGDNINVGGEFTSGLYPDASNTYDLGDQSRQWRNGFFAGDVTVQGSLVAAGGTAITGTISTATRATLVDTTATSTNATYYVPFVDTFAGQNGEAIRVGAGLSLNPSDGSVATGGILSVGNAANLTSYIKSGGGSNAMYMYANGDVSFQAKIITNSIRSSGDLNNALTLTGRDVTFGNSILVAGITTTATFKLSGTSGIGITGISASTSLAENSDDYLPTQKAVKAYIDAIDVDDDLGIAGDTGTGTIDLDSQSLTVAGTANQVTTSASGQTITLSLPSTVVVGTAVSAPSLQTATLKHQNGTSAATIDTSGNITASQNLTVSGNLYVNGSTTQVNTASITVEDRTIELGQVDGAAPSSATTWDLGVLFNYNASGAKKSGVIWEHADGRFKFGSQVSDGGGTNNDSPQITVSNYASIEIGSLWINDCAGQSEVISCSNGLRTLQNITIDCGTF